MKKAIKYIIIVVCAFFLAILTFLFINLCFAGFSCNSFVYGGKWEEREKVFETADVESLKLRLSKGSLSVQPSTDEKITIKYYDSKKCSYSFTEKDGALTIKQVNNSLFFPISFKDTKYNVVLYLPENYGKDLRATLTDGNAKIENLFFEDLDVAVGTGSVNLTAIKSSTIKATAVNGNVAFADVDGTILTFSTTNGNVLGSLPREMQHYYIKSIIKSSGKNNLPESFTEGAIYLTAQTYKGNITITFKT